MEHHQDEHIVCADCGASFVFSAAEADVFAQRGLTAPKRCKECRRARKQQNGLVGGYPRGPRAEGGRPSPGGDQGGRWGGQAPAYDARGPRRGPPQYTGDVNEYRSPMATGATGGPWRGPDAPAPRRPPTRSGPAPYRGGDYRSPMGNGPAPYRSGDYRSPMGNGSAPYRSGDYRGPMPDRGFAQQGGQVNGNRARNGHAPAQARGPAPRPPLDEADRRRRRRTQGRGGRLPPPSRSRATRAATRPRSPSSRPRGARCTASPATAPASRYRTTLPAPSPGRRPSPGGAVALCPRTPGSGRAAHERHDPPRRPRPERPRPRRAGRPAADLRRARRSRAHGAPRGRAGRRRSRRRRPAEPLPGPLVQRRVPSRPHARPGARRAPGGAHGRPRADRGAARGPIPDDSRAQGPRRVCVPRSAHRPRHLRRRAAARGLAVHRQLLPRGRRHLPHPGSAGGGHPARGDERGALPLARRLGVAPRRHRPARRAPRATSRRCTTAARGSPPIPRTSC